MYLKPLNRYFIRTCIKLEDQINYRKAAWLIGVRDFILIKEFYERDSETLIEFKKVYTDKKVHVIYSSYWVKGKTNFFYNIG